ncbi:MAG: hypothetical protein WAZ12_01475 [Candidatus Absconditicoccaceae bacterium]
MQKILNFWNDFLAFGAEAWHEFVSDNDEAWHEFVSAPGKFIALMVVMLILGLIINRVGNALLRSKFMQYKSK